MLRFYGIVLAFCFFAATTSAQENFTQIGSAGDEFTFIRIQFDSMGQGWGRGGWAHDYPEAEINFLRGVTRLSGIHIYYDIDGAQRIPGIYFLHGNAPSDHMNTENWAILDDEGRIMILINWNSDMGDGWEHTYDADYPTKYANLAYRLGINYLVYALTH